MKLVALFTAAVIGGCGIAVAQTTPPATTTTPAMPATPATPAAKPTMPVTPGATTTDAPLAGANSFTEGQARSWLEKAGYTEITGLTKSEDGVWRGTAHKGSLGVTVAVDFKGNVTAR